MKFSREFKIGLVTLIALGLLLWGVNYLKGINIFRPTARYYVIYNDVSGLIESAVVYCNGMNIGKVNRIEFDGGNLDRIVVELSMDRKIRLARNTKAVLKSSSLISSTKDLYLIPGEGPGEYAPGDTLTGVTDGGLLDSVDPLLEKVGLLVTTLDSLAFSLNSLVDETTRDGIRGMVESLNTSVASLKKSLQPDGSIYSSLDNLTSVTENLRKSNEDISRVLNNLADVSDTLVKADISALVANLNQTFTGTASLLESINKGKGSAGQILTSDSLYTNLNIALESLDKLLNDLREHPGRYIQLSVFGRKN